MERAMTQREAIIFYAFYYRAHLPKINASLPLIFATLSNNSTENCAYFSAIIKLIAMRYL